MSLAAPEVSKLRSSSQLIVWKEKFQIWYKLTLEFQLYMLYLFGPND
jgi:hypothetical protein